MPREARNFTRISGTKDPSLIIIAMEGARTEQDYFAGVNDKCEENQSRLKFKLLPPRVNTVSAPKYVLAQMDEYKKEFGINKDDELCLVIDRDRQSWGEAALADIAQQCDAKQYLLALSNPCFELWLILHHLDVANSDQEIKSNLLDNRNQYSKQKLRELLGGYNPSNLQIDDFWADTAIAIERAKNLDIEPKNRWPNDLGTVG
jgi:hypothetical protein